MSALFITGSGTDIGKTLVTCILCHQLRRAGRSVDALKPVISGFDAANPAASDTAQLLAALGRPVDDTNLAAISPWRFAAPLSPDMAAKRERRHIDFDELIDFCREAEKPGRVLLIEGVGGVMVPIDEHHTTLEWMAALGAPVLLVVGSYLGTLSHTLTAVEALRSYKLELTAIVVSESAHSPVPLAETVASLKRFCDAPLLSLPRLAPDSDEIWKVAPNLAETISDLALT